MYGLVHTLTPLHLTVLGGMHDGVGSLCEHPQARYGGILATAIALFSSTIAIALSGTTTPITTTAPTPTTAQQLHLVELVVGLGKGGSEHDNLVLGGHQVGPGAGSLLHLVNHFEGLKDFILGHLPLVVGRVGGNYLVAKHFVVVPQKLVKE